MDTRFNREVVGSIRNGMILNGLNLENLAVATGINERTLRRRMRDPETFSVGELRRVCKRLHIEVTMGGQ